MVISVDGALIVHIDVCPDEQARPDDESVKCMIGLVSDNPEGLGEISKQYKLTKGLPAKTRRAQVLSAAIRDDRLGLHAVACAGHSSQWHRYGTGILGSMPSSVVAKCTKGFRVDGEYIPRPTACAMGTYAAGLSIICLKTSIWANRLGVSKIKVLLDKLPTRDVGDANKLLRVILNSPEHWPVWNNMRKSFSVDFEFGDDWTYGRDDEFRKTGKNHPNSIITDWIAQSFNAAANPELWLSASAKATETHRLIIADPFFALHEQRRIEIIDLNRLIPQKMAASPK